MSKTTSVTLQVLAKDNVDVCVVNVLESKLSGEKSPSNIHETYCRILHKAIYEGHTIEKGSSQLPDAVIEELTNRMERQILPRLNSQKMTCEDFFKVRDHQEIKSAYPEYSEATIYDVKVNLHGCFDISVSEF